MGYYVRGTAKPCVQQFQGVMRGCLRYDRTKDSRSTEARRIRGQGGRAKRATGQRLDAIIKAAAPVLPPKTWYGMPAYANDGKVVCFFRRGEKFKERYVTLGFNDAANLDEGHMWPIAFALTELTAAEEARIDALVKKAVS